VGDDKTVVRMGHPEWWYSGASGVGHEEPLGGNLVEEADLKLHLQDLMEFRFLGVTAAGAEASQGAVAGAGHLHTDGEQGSVEIEDAAEFDLQLEAESDLRDIAAVQHPAAATHDGVHRRRQQVFPFAVAVGLDCLDILYLHETPSALKQVCLHRHLYG